MPIYEYVCDDCGAHYEKIVMNGNTKITCPKCASAKSTIQLSVFAAHGNGTKASGGSSPVRLGRRLLRRRLRLRELTGRSTIAARFERAGGAVTA